MQNVEGTVSAFDIPCSLFYIQKAPSLGVTNALIAFALFTRCLEVVAMGGSLGLVEVLIILAVSLVPAVLFWRIFSKAGFSGALALIALIPGLGFTILVLMLAFSEWPIERELRDARQEGYA